MHTCMAKVNMEKRILLKKQFIYLLLKFYLLLQRYIIHPIHLEKAMLR